MKTIEDLKKIGFEKVGEWELSIDNQLVFNVNDDNTKEILYSFILNETKIIYIGKTIKTITERMKGYKKPGKSQNTNIRLNKIILQELNNKNKIDIYMLKTTDIVYFKQLKINLAAGLEDILIKLYKPQHNLHGNFRVIEDVEIGENEVILTNHINNEESECNNLFKCHKTATNSHLKGYINLGNIPHKYLPNIGEIITIYLDNAITTATFINANQQGGWNPRINNALIGKWLQQNNIMKEGTFYFKICNNNTFYFYIN